MTISIEISPEVLAAIAWLKDKPKVYSYGEKDKNMQIVEKFLDNLLKSAQSPNAS